MEKMNINNLELIKPLLHLEKEGDFIQIFVLLRKKDQPEGQKDNHQSVRIIKSYCVESIEYLDKKMPEIIALCEYFNARAYININEKSHNNISLLMMEKLASRIRNNVKNQVNLFDTVSGELKSKRNRWIIDIDTKDERYMQKVITCIEAVKPFNPDLTNIEPYKIIEEIPTLNGFHLITKPFDVFEFTKYLFISESLIPEIQKNNPTILYVPSKMFNNE